MVGAGASARRDLAVIGMRGGFMGVIGYRALIWVAQRS